ncbi:MAG: phospholipid carrier-dependent glycosyltransferase [Sphingobium sp.]|nr:phospholipid carrier-dependent glycosyltransferase [Sphingobium sp.]
MAIKTEGKLSTPDWRDLLIALGLAAVALALFLWRIGDPAKLNFDETHYVPAAHTLMDFAALPNAEHPPLGKLLIGLSFTIFGDSFGGARIMSALFGTLTVLSGVMAARWLFLRRPAAIMTGVLMLFSQTLFIQARIAMLDIFMVGFLMLGFWILLAAVRRSFTDRWRLPAGGAALGLAAACKWTAVPLILVGVPLAFYLYRQSAKAERKDTLPPLRDALGWLIVPLILAYLATFLPYMFLRTGAVSLVGILPEQFAMLRLQSMPMSSHPYQSVWWQWIIDQRPIWYFYEPVAGVQRGVLFLGNPILCWGGLAALVACLWAGFKEDAKPLLVPVLFWAVPLFFFILAPKPVQFYYHYLLPSLMLCFASAGALDHYFWRHGSRVIPLLALGLTGLVFLEFYPIISAAALGDPQDFNRWMWFDSWR